MTILHGAHVTLRTMTADELDTVIQLFGDPVLAEAWPGDNAARLPAMLEPGADGVPMVVELDGTVIGYIQYFEEDDPNYRHAMIDIVIGSGYTDRGLGTDAMRTLVRHLFDDCGHHRIAIDPNVDNARAIASYRKVGFKDVGVMRQYERANDGVWRDALLMDLVREELM